MEFEKYSADYAIDCLHRSALKQKTKYEKGLPSVFDLSEEGHKALMDEAQDEALSQKKLFESGRPSYFGYSPLPYSCIFDGDPSRCIRALSNFSGTIQQGKAATCEKVCEVYGINKIAFDRDFSFLFDSKGKIIESYFVKRFPLDLDDLQREALREKRKFEHGKPSAFMSKKDKEKFIEDIYQKEEDYLENKKNDDEADAQNRDRHWWKGY